MSYFRNATKHERGFDEVAVDSLASQPAHRLIDVRSPEEFTGDLGHIPNAELMPLSMISRLAAKLDRTEPLLIVCRSGQRSARAVELLSQLGFERIANVKGGMLAFRALRAVA